MNTGSDSGTRPAPGHQASLMPTGARAVKVNDCLRLVRWHYLPWRAAVARFIVAHGYREEVARADESDWIDAYDRSMQPGDAVLAFIDRRGVVVE